MEVLISVGFACISKICCYKGDLNRTLSVVVGVSGKLGKCSYGNVAEFYLVNVLGSARKEGCDLYYTASQT